MTTEDDFQRALDANPEDWQTRLVFADWLQERDDPRAEGYRAMGRNRLAPMLYHYGKFWHWMETITGRSSGALLKSWWYSELAFTHAKLRRDLEDAAAFAFSRLPEARRREILESSAPALPATA